MMETPMMVYSMPFYVLAIVCNRTASEKKKKKKKNMKNRPKNPNTCFCSQGKLHQISQNTTPAVSDAAKHVDAAFQGLVKSSDLHQTLLLRGF